MNRQEANAAIRRTNIRGKEYAEVSQRILAFWEMFPNGSIITELLSDDGDRCVFKATAYDKDMPMATGHAFELRMASNVNKTSYLENCETSAVGRALGILGIGSDGSLASADEVAAAIEQQAAGTPVKERYAQPVAQKRKQAAKAATEPCSEWSAMVKAVQDYVEITGEPKKASWERWGASVAKDDAEMCIAVIADIEAALNA